MMFDLARLDTLTPAEKGSEFTFRRIDGSPVLMENKKPFTMRLLGSNSRVVRATMRRFEQEIAARRAALPSGEAAPVEQWNEEGSIEMLSAATVGWPDDVSMGGEPFPFSPENARKFWADDRFASWRMAAALYVTNDGNYYLD